MIEEFEMEYMENYWNHKMFQWINYFEHGNYDLKENEMLSGIERENIEDVLPQVCYPWRRYLARSFDGIMYMILWAVSLAYFSNT